MFKDTEKRLIKTLEFLKEPQGSAISTIVKVMNGDGPQVSPKKVVQTLRGCLKNGTLKVSDGRVKFNNVDNFTNVKTKEEKQIIKPSSRSKSQSVRQPTHSGKGYFRKTSMGGCAKANPVPNKIDGEKGGEEKPEENPPPCPECPKCPKCKKKRKTCPKPRSRCRRPRPKCPKPRPKCPRSRTRNSRKKPKKKCPQRRKPVKVQPSCKKKNPKPSKPAKPPCP